MYGLTELLFTVNLVRIFRKKDNVLPSLLWRKKIQPVSKMGLLRSAFAIRSFRSGTCACAQQTQHQVLSVPALDAQFKDEQS